MELNLKRYHKLLKKADSGQNMDMNELLEIANSSLHIGAAAASFVINNTCPDIESKFSAVDELSQKLIKSIFNASGFDTKIIATEVQEDSFEMPVHDRAGNC